MMRIEYVIPGPMGRTEAGRAEVARRDAILRSWAAPETEVKALDTTRGPASIESSYEDHLCVEPLAEALADAESRDIDALIIGCFDDPGIEALRELATKILVVGPAHTSIYTAMTLAETFGIITVPEPGSIRRLVRLSGVEARLTDIAVVDIPVLNLGESKETTYRKVLEAGRELVSKGAESLVLGCLSLAFLQISDDLARELGVPVINPVRVALTTAEALVRCGLLPSRATYPLPPKVVAGTAVSQLNLSCTG